MSLSKAASPRPNAATTSNRPTAPTPSQQPAKVPASKTMTDGKKKDAAITKDLKRKADDALERKDAPKRRRMETSASPEKEAEKVSVEAMMEANPHGILCLKILLRRKEVTRRLVKILRSDDRSRYDQDMKEISGILNREIKYINKFYQTKNKDTLMHLAVKRRVRKVTLQAFCDAGFPLLVPNSKMKLPTDYTMGIGHGNWQAPLLERAIRDRRDQKLKDISELSYLFGDRSRIHPGRYVTPDLSLIFGSKKRRKICIIPDRWEKLDKEDELDLTLHQRLAIAEAMVSSNAQKVEGVKENNSSNNFVTANIGFVVSTKVHKQGGDHGRRFVTIPIVDAKHLTFRPSSSETTSHKIHSERVLYKYLSNTENLAPILNYLRITHGIDARYKIYAVVLDIHSGLTMCEKCESHAYRQGDRTEAEKFIRILEKELKKQGYILPKPKRTTPDILTPSSRRLHLVTRVSATEEFNFNDDRPQDELGYEYPHHEDVEYFDRDVKKFNNSVVLHRSLHDDKESRFRKKESYSALETKHGFLAMYRQTAFVNYNKDRAFNCTRRDKKDKQFATHHVQLIR
jgi:hypothetical protein